MVEKRVNGCFVGTALEGRLRAARMTGALEICGVTTGHRVSATARMAANTSFAAVSDARATFDREGPDGRAFLAGEAHEVSLASLHGAFAEAVSSGPLPSEPEAGNGARR
ncbi:cysteine hydrolase family protein [Rubrobacter tropicus]|uniref:isochorismatase family protein n=1 Tax=Rubrobacter tropicus TaxID=2653851 RepID=UPI001A9E251A